jgi:hypothetical protein
MQTSEDISSNQEVHVVSSQVTTELSYSLNDTQDNGSGKDFRLQNLPAKKIQ